MTNRDRILQAASDMLYRRGYIATSVDDIIAAAGVSKSNFYYHFPSKEDLGLAVLSIRRDALESLLSETLRSPGHPATYRLARFIAELADGQTAQAGKHGCPFGNLVAEMTEHSERIRCFLSGVFEDVKADVAVLVQRGQADGDFRRDVPAPELANFIVQAIQGMHLLAKCNRDAETVRPSARVLLQLLAPQNGKADESHGM